MKQRSYEVDDHIRISKYENIISKVCTPNWSEGFFVIEKVKNTVLLSYVIEDVNGEEIVGTFYEKKNCKRQNK